MDKHITFFTTKAGYYGYTTTNNRMADGSQIVSFDEGTKTVITSVPATKQNYAYAKQLVKAARHSTERFLSLLKLNLSIFA